MNCLLRISLLFLFLSAHFYSLGVTTSENYVTNGYYLGSIATITDKNGSILQTNRYLSGGLPQTAMTVNDRFIDNHLYCSMQYTGTHSMGFYDNTARIYDAILTRFTTQDPLSEKYPDISPYASRANNPMKYVDRDGKSPIYDMDGTFLGTDDKGLQGEYLIMSKDVFEQSMKHSDAVNNAYIGAIDSDVRQKIWDHHATLGDRPDWDGKLTLSEANEWYRNGKGKDLYIDINSIDLSSFYSLGDKYIGKQYYFNLLIYGNPLDGLVYGNLGFERTANNSVKSLGDIYDFDIKEWSKKNIVRNIETYIGAWVAGTGVPYKIIIYGEQKLKTR